MHVLGFKPLSCLAAHHQLTHGLFVYPSERQLKGSCRAFMALHAAMRTKQQMAVACYVRTQASVPRLVALLVQEELLEAESGRQVSSDPAQQRPVADQGHVYLTPLA